MSVNGWVQLVLYMAVLLLLVKPLGAWMARVYEGRSLFGLERVLGPVERLLYRLSGVRPEQEMRWTTYAAGNAAVQCGRPAVRLPAAAPAGCSPAQPCWHAGGGSALRMERRGSFATNTNWQNYGGETTLSYLTQMLGLTVQNFMSAATGMAVLVALIRGLARRQASSIGNFWVDLTRTTLYILLPSGSRPRAGCRLSQGVVQTLDPYASATLIEPVAGRQRPS